RGLNEGGVSVLRRIVTLLGVNYQLWKALRRVELDFYFAPFPVAIFVGRDITHDVLIAQFRVNQIDIIIQLIKIVRKERAPAGKPDYILDLRTSIPQFALFSDRIDLNVGLLGKLPDLGGGIAAAVVFA